MKKLFLFGMIVPLVAFAISESEYQDAVRSIQAARGTAIDRQTHPDHKTAYAAEWQCIQILYKYVACAGVVLGGDAAENKWKIEAYAATFAKGSQERTDILEDSTMMMGAWVYVDRYYRDGAGASIPKDQQWIGARYISQ